MELFSDSTPVTAEYFRALCTGEKGMGKRGKSLHYKGSIFDWVKPGQYCKGGYIPDQNDGGPIFGSDFNYEKSISKHTGAGILSSPNVSPRSDKTHFCIFLKEESWRDGRYVAFGQVVKGFEVVKAIVKQSSKVNVFCQFSVPIVIADCGQLPLQTISKVPSPSIELEQVIANTGKHLRDNLKQSREEFEQLTTKHVQNIVDIEKVKGVVDFTKEVEELVKLEDIFKQHVKVMRELLKKEISLWEENSKMQLSEIQKKIASRKNSIVALETIQSVPYENLASIESAIKKRKVGGQ